MAVEQLVDKLFDALPFIPGQGYPVAMQHRHISPLQPDQEVFPRVATGIVGTIFVGHFISIHGLFPQFVRRFSIHAIEAVDSTRGNAGIYITDIPVAVFTDKRGHSVYPVLTPRGYTRINAVDKPVAVFTNDRHGTVYTIFTFQRVEEILDGCTRLFPFTSNHNSKADIPGS